MKRLTIAFYSLILSVPLIAGCQTAGTPASAASDAKPVTAAGQVERGRYLVTAMGCNDCHTPLKMTNEGPQPDMTRMLSGHPAEMKMPLPPKMEGPWLWAGAATNTAFAGPWGVSYAFNLTPDQNTGLGIWTEEMFLKTMQTGRHMGTSRPIKPPMPWPVLKSLTDDDLKSVFAYLRSIPPVKNQVPTALDPEEVASTLKQ
jgi:cytochrome c553